jgi:acyl-CoA synthetase (AMP-forming)/AMP-acid ligase II
MKDQIDSLYGLFAQRAETQADDPAFFSPESTFSYAEFLHLVDEIAAGLHQQGLGKGDRVATIAKNSISHFAALVASTRLGAIVFPVNWRLASNELEQALNLVEPTALFIEPEFYTSFSDNALNKIRIKVLFGEEVFSGFTVFDEILSPKDLPSVPVQQEDPAVIIATAAVAGLPRGAVLTHGNLLAVSRMFRNAFHLTTSDRYLGVLPLFHIAGLEYLIVTAMSGGASVILPGFDADLGNQLIEQQRVSLLVTFPPMLENLIAAKEQSGADWKNLRFCWGILNPPEVVQKYLSLERGEYWTGYGQTETTGIATLGNYQEKPGSAGRVVAGLELRIVDDDDQTLPPNQPGEIAVRGNLVFAQYWGDEEASAYAARGGWHHTGDMGKVDENGYLYYVGRKPEKELIKSGGENIYPAEVEAAIRKLSQVSDVCVIGIPDDRWGETVKAVVELVPDQQLDAGQLQDGISEHLAAYKKPRVVEFVDHIPRDKQGKIDRLQVKEKFG